MAPSSFQDTKQRIQDAGLRATAPRVAVLRLLTDSRKPLSHAEVVAAIGNESWDQATIYRNLIKLVEVSLARVASQIGGISRYEALDLSKEAHSHPHFTCRECGTVECMPEATLSGPVSRGWRRSVAASDIQLVGDCPGCLEQQKTAGRPQK